ncbi:MAG: cystathionine gamma-synthase [Candidatus Latescibacteria bacterium]|nr:cystathionine gamma-synthase [bacterium]MCB9514478.1 cystathionine gamma-synthase [Candidatus Latescibacterota bacterium]MCB9515951.1 cystathionine gamma-synthase [Candidatus Latescibacterota bacterium]
MATRKSTHVETLAVHGGQRPDPLTGAVSVPIYQTSTYAQRAPGEHLGFEYSRTDNPTRSALQASLAALEGGERALVFASGMAAADAVLHLFAAGDHVLCCDDLYGGSYRLFDKVYRRQGLRFDFVDLTDPARLDAALTPATKLLWLETPTNPMLKVLDVAALAARCRERGVLCLVDNTFLSPALQNPLALGADIVLHSTTKYVNGHADAVGGALVTADPALGQRLAFIQNAVGAVPGPQDCYLVLRGIKTLALRMRQHEANAAAVAAHLDGHPQVERLYWPGLASHPGHAVAARQAKGFGGVISFVLAGGLPAAKRFLGALGLFTLAESLGGVESLVEHPAIMTHASVEREIRERLGIVDGLIRLSVGIEHPDDLLADLDAGFAAAR